MLNREGVAGVKELFQNLSRYEGKVVDTVKDVTEITQALVVNHARANHGANAHSNKRWIARTGNTEASILPGRIILTDDEVEAEVASNVEWASFLEFGTSRARAYPYMEPALRSEQRAFGQRLARALKDLKP